MKYFVILAAATLAAGCQPNNLAEEDGYAYTYGDDTGNEVRATAQTLNTHIAGQFLNSSQDLRIATAIMAQREGNGVLCDLLATSVLMENDPELTIDVAGEQAQMACFQFMMSMDPDSVL